MKRLQRAAVVLALADTLKDKGSWCGETHLQKAAYFLEELADVPLDLGFMLYKHGPYSFELSDELTALRADGLLEFCPRPYPYGPSLLTTESGKALQRRWPKTLSRHQDQIKFVASRLGDKGVAELERLGTALYMTKKHPGKISKRAERIHKLKPHVSATASKTAVETVDKMIEECPSSG